MSALALKYKASRITVRDVLQALATDGLVTIEQGRGTFPTIQSRRRPKPIDPVANFKRWKVSAELDSDFPNLDPLAWAELEFEHKKWYMGLPQMDAMKEITTAASAVDLTPRTHVQVARGHGCTSLFRYTFKDFTTSGERALSRSQASRTIPVRITWQRLGESLDTTRNGLEESIRYDCLVSLANWDWGNIRQVPYARLIGAIRPDQRRPVLEDHLDQIRQHLGGENLDADGCPIPGFDRAALADLCPDLMTKPLEEMLVALVKVGLRVLFMFDFSVGGADSPMELGASMYDMRVSRVTKLVRDLRIEIEKVTGPDPPIGEMFFTDMSTVGTVQQIDARAVLEIEYPHYEQVDIFSILKHHYPPLIRVETQGQRVRSLQTADLPAVIPSSALDQVNRDLYKIGRGFEHFSIRELVRMFEEKLLDMQFRKEWRNVQFQQL